jgi:hypothetical protein
MAASAELLTAANSKVLLFLGLIAPTSSIESPYRQRRLFKGAVR